MDPVKEWQAEKEQRAAAEVVEQALDNSIDNREPVTFRQIISQIAAVIVTMLLFKGVLEPQEGTVLIGQTEIIVGAIFTIAGIVGSVAGRMKASSPKTAAGVAITNAVLPPSATPTLDVNDAAVEAVVRKVV